MPVSTNTSRAFHAGQLEEQLRKLYLFYDFGGYQCFQMLVKLNRQIAAFNQNAKLHISFHGRSGQVCAGNKSELLIGYSAFCMNRTGGPICSSPIFVGCPSIYVD